MNSIAWVVLVAFIVLAAIATQNVEPKGATMDQAQYCDMVHERAWPDFHHNYKKACLKDGKVNVSYMEGK